MLNKLKMVGMKQLREILKERGIAFKVVSDALGVHVNHIARYDDLSKRSLAEVLKISETTGIPLEELTGAKIRTVNGFTQTGNNNVNIQGNANRSIIAGGSVDNSKGKNETNNYHGLSVEELVRMMEERFQHMLRKEDDIRAIFDENRKLTDEVIKQNADFRLYNEAYRKLQERINDLTTK
jgi:hypothetical protein